MSGRLLAGAAFAAIALLLSACSTPRHTNTLIFGTNTKFALDVSQDPTGGVGVTLGYKREEAVWMPLLANQAASTGAEKPLVPAGCGTSTECPMFAGRAGEGGPAGKGAVDTYSVLATFSGAAAGAAGGQAANAQANGTLAQYFATGFAARLLAASGSSVVNTAGGVSQQVAETNRQLLEREDQQIKKIMAAVIDEKSLLVPKKLEDLAGKAEFSESNRRYVLSRKNAQSLQSALEDGFQLWGAPLYKVIASSESKQ